MYMCKVQYNTVYSYMSIDIRTSGALSSTVSRLARNCIGVVRVRVIHNTKDIYSIYYCTA